MRAWEAIAGITGAEHARFATSLQHPEEAQAGQLRDILRINADSAFGRQYSFHDLGDVDSYRERVPPQDPENLRVDPGQMAASNGDRLCGTPIVAFDRTSGTTSGGRIVPYTEAGLAAFRRAVFPWIHDLLADRPGVAAGRAYWAVSPVGRSPGSAGPRLASDADFFGPELGPLIGAVSAAPLSLGRIADIETWRYVVLRYLVAAEDLSLVSVWSPTFLTGLFDTLIRLGEPFVDDVARGVVSRTLPQAGSGSFRFDPRADRAEALAVALASTPQDMSALWPALDTVSCWTHGSAARFVPGLARALPGARIQPKGLMATEAAVSIPLSGHPWPVLAVNSGFFEFVDDEGSSRLCHEVQDGATYSVRITTHSGLYRYDLGDRVRIRGFLGRTPGLEFVGRGVLTSDLVGEKLADHFVQQALGDAPGFAMLAPVIEPSRHYVLILDASTGSAAAQTRAASVERRLSENPHYRYARRLGQLGPVTAVRIESAMARYQAECLARGHRLGDIKPPALRPETDWLEHLLPQARSERTRRSADTLAMEATP